VPQPAVFAPVPWTEHALLDSGGGEKLERFGALVLHLLGEIGRGGGRV
jgi:hypothetical protein